MRIGLEGRAGMRGYFPAPAARSASSDHAVPIVSLIGGCRRLGPALCEKRQWPYHLGAEMPTAVSDFAVSRYDRDSGRIGGRTDPLHDPLIGAGGELDMDAWTICPLGPIRRTRAIEHDPDLRVGIREAPGESDQALPHRPAPPGRDVVSSLTSGLSSGLPSDLIFLRLGSEDSRVEGVVAVDEPESGRRKGRGLRLLGSFRIIFLVSRLHSGLAIRHRHHLALQGRESDRSLRPSIRSIPPKLTRLASRRLPGPARLPRPRAPPSPARKRRRRP